MLNINLGAFTPEIILSVGTTDGSVASIYLDGVDTGKKTSDNIGFPITSPPRRITLVSDNIEYNEEYTVSFVNSELKITKSINGNIETITPPPPHIAIPLIFTPKSTNGVTTVDGDVPTAPECIKYLLTPFSSFNDRFSLTETDITSTDNVNGDNLDNQRFSEDTLQTTVRDVVQYIGCDSDAITTQTITQPTTIFAKRGSVVVFSGEIAITEETETDDIGRPTVERSTITINIDGEDDSITLETPQSERTLLDKSNTITGIKDSIYRIKSSNATLFRISKITVSDGQSQTEYESDGDDESLSITIPIRDGIVVDVISERVVYRVTPEIKIESTERIEYNLNSNEDLIIRTFPKNAEGVKVLIDNREYCYTIKEFDGRLVEIVGEESQTSDGYIERCSKVKDINTGELNDENVEIRNFYNVIIPKRALTSVKVHTISITPINRFGEGESVSTSVNVFDGVLIETPDLLNIEYPSKLQGPDFRGTDVPFTINWESKNTNYVKVYYGNQRELYTTTTQNSLTLNVGEVLKNIPQSELQSVGGFLNFTITLVPINTEGFEDRRGVEETLTIGFKEGDLLIPRDVAIERISDSFLNQLNISIFENTVSNLLNHFLHLGDGRNVLISNWLGSNDGSLIIKLYEPLPVDIQINNTGWISKIQSTPTIQTISIFGEVDDNYPFIKGPNFSIDVDGGAAYQIVDDILNKSNPQTSEQLIIDYVNKSGIDISSLDIEYSDGDTILFSNFVHFGSATERIINYEYKLGLIGDYEDKIISLESLSNPTVSDNRELEKTKDLRRTIIGGFDGFERFLYTEASPSVISNAMASAQLYDRNNVNYLVNNIPTYLIQEGNNSEFILFLDMIGQHFDILWAYTKGIVRSKKVRETTKNNLSNKLVYHMLQSFGWNPKRAFDTNALWESAFGKASDGTVLFNTSLESATNEVWKRIINNLPYLLKHKGTKRAIQAMMACYGVPNSMLTIFEFGGPSNQKNAEPSKFTFDDTTFSILFDGQSIIEAEWKEYEGEYPQSVELRVNTIQPITQSLLKTNGWELSLIPTNTGSYGVLQLDIDSQITTTSPMPFFTDEFNHIVVNKNVGSIDIYGIRNDVDDIKQIVSASISTTVGWDNGSVIEMGDGFVGELDEFRIWKTPLEERVILAHSLFPQSISGNTLTSSTDDLLFRLDFELPRNRGSLGDTAINNVAINQTYASDATAVGFTDIVDYPFNYKNYNRTVTATLPSLGFTYSDKVRIEEQELVEDLSYNRRVTTKAFDRSPIDSNRLGIFLSPTKELNMDIIKSFGDTLSIDDLIGNPSDLYNDRYKGLDTVRDYYFKRLNRNIYEYINLIRYIDKSLFDTLTELVPVRSKVSKGLLIEPHLLERSKVQWKRPIGEESVSEGIVDGDLGFDISSMVSTNEAVIRFDEVEDVNVELGSIDVLLQYSTDESLTAENPTYESTIQYEEFSNLIGDIASLASTIRIEEIGSIKTETELELDLSANKDTTFRDLGFGLYAINGTASFFNQFDNFGNLIREYRRVLVLEEKEDVRVQSFIPESSSFQTFIVPKFTTTVTTLPLDSTVDIQPDGDRILSVTPLNGYLPSHYKNKLVPTGLKNSFYNGAKQTIGSTPDGLPPVETFTTNPNILRVADTGRGSGEPILKIS